MIDERRRFKREVVTVPVDYAYARVNDKNELRCVTGKGITMNVSREGIGIYTSQSINEGIDLKVFSMAIWNAPKNGIVRWCSKISNDLYRVGLSIN